MRRGVGHTSCLVFLAYLDVPTLGQPEAFLQAKDGLFDQAGNIGADHKQFLQLWMDRFGAWVKRLASPTGGVVTHAA